MDEAVEAGPATGGTAGAGTTGIVLASGRSSRMGRSKPLLEARDGSFLGATIAALLEGGCDEVVAVVADEEAAVEATAAGARTAPGRPGGEQIDSLRRGLEAVDPGGAAALVLPVDHPLVTAATVRAVLEAAATHPGSIVRPVFDGRPGHPTLFPSRVWPALRAPDLQHGARSVVEGEVGVEGAVVDVAVDDAGVVADIDTPGAYDRFVGRRDG